MRPHPRCAASRGSGPRVLAATKPASTCGATSTRGRADLGTARRAQSGPRCRASSLPDERPLLSFRGGQGGGLGGGCGDPCPTWTSASVGTWPGCGSARPRTSGSHRLRAQRPGCAPCRRTKVSKPRHRPGACGRMTDRPGLAVPGPDSLSLARLQPGSSKLSSLLGPDF